jgi:transcriptional regulator with XRE-family HTH domain
MPAGRPSKSKRNLFGQRIYEKRVQQGLSQKEVAAKLGITQQSYAAWERRPLAIRPAHLVMLAKLFNTTVNDLLAGTTTNRTNPVKSILQQIQRLPVVQQKKMLAHLQALLEPRKKR